MSSPSIFKIGVGQAAANSTALLLIGTSSASTNVLVGGTITVAPAELTDAFGVATSHTPIPLDVSSIGIPFYTQWLIVESNAVALSNAASFIPFQF